MRNIFLCFSLLITSHLFGQSFKYDSLFCSSNLVVNEDKISGKSTYGLKKPLKISGGGDDLLMDIFNNSTGVTTWIISLANIKNCISEKAEIDILFKYDKRLHIVSNSSFNCKGIVITYMVPPFRPEQQIIDLATNSIDSIRVWAGDNKYDFMVDEKTSKIIKDCFYCLYSIISQYDN